MSDLPVTVTSHCTNRSAVPLDLPSDMTLGSFLETLRTDAELGPPEAQWAKFQADGGLLFDGKIISFGPKSGNDGRTLADLGLKENSHIEIHLDFKVAAR